jgi:lipopolysaccharide/colanic/teichoic acid biosynthesis glycosyltransferase
MSALIAQLTTLKQEFAQEIERFMLLWSYQHPSPPFALWWRLVLKRFVDAIGAALLLVTFSPVLLVLAILIRLDSKGPVLFSQERIGRFGERFNMHKFRSMVPDAEAGTGPVRASLANDPRVTRLGRFLRRTHLDELPQLFNVLVGDMSLVGPRPERLCFVKALERAVPRYDHRLYVKPGMTGLAQVHYRYDQTVADVKKKLRFDLLYVKRMCLMLDVKILAWTFIVVVTGKGIGIR